jgi:hypothetical protein
MTPKVLSIRDKYKEPCSNMLEVVNSSCTGNCVQTMSMEKKTLKEALDDYNTCQVGKTLSRTDALEFQMPPVRLTLGNAGA